MFLALSDALTDLCFTINHNYRLKHYHILSQYYIHRHHYHVLMHHYYDIIVAVLITHSVFILMVIQSTLSLSQQREPQRGEWLRLHYLCDITVLSDQLCSSGNCQQLHRRYTQLMKLLSTCSADISDKKQQDTLNTVIFNYMLEICFAFYHLLLSLQDDINMQKLYGLLVLWISTAFF